MNALTKTRADASDLLWEEKALRDAPTLFDSRDILRALEAKYGAAAQYAFGGSVWLPDEEKEEGVAKAEAALRERRR